MSGAAAASAGAAAAAIANAVKASGVIVQVSPEDFRSILHRMADGLVVTAEGGYFSTHYLYLTSYRGLAFHTKTARPLNLPPHMETITAKKIWIPG
jgi:hypothetical protein